MQPARNPATAQGPPTRPIASVRPDSLIAVLRRTREYAADDMGARLSANPQSLASALAKIDVAAREIENVPAEQNPATAHLFIINPLSGERMDNLFSTHPSTENRIAALEQLAAQMGVVRSAWVRWGQRRPWA